MTRVDESVVEIKQMILDNRYNQDGYLPSEGELSDQLEVSRATIREAVRTLEVRGFVKRIHGKGIKVSNNGVKVVTRSMRDMFERESLSIDEILEVRWLIETKAAEMAADTITKEELKILLGLVEEMEQADVNDGEYLKCDYKFHQKLVECAKNKMMIAIVNAYSGLLGELIKATNYRQENLEKTYHYHRNVYTALENRNGELAKHYMEEHLTAASKNKK